MPWSEWQTSDPYDVGAARLAVQFQAHAVDGVYTTTGSNTAGDGAGLQREVITDPGNNYSTDDNNGMQYAEPVGWADERDWFPSPLYAMEEGVDFAVRPDRTGDEGDAYVQYEAGPSTRTDWIITGAPQVTLNSQNPPGGVSYTWSLGVRTGTSYVLGTANPVGFPGVGAVFATGDQTTPTGAVLNAVPAMGRATSFFISAQLDSVSLTDDFQVYVTASLPRPFMRVTQPRWRYWIPGVVAYPLRQKQRNDGLARGVYRARSTSSIQNSVRQNSYR